jgi:hypothetical protein
VVGLGLDFRVGEEEKGLKERGRSWGVNQEDGDKVKRRRSGKGWRKVWRGSSAG